MTQLAAAVQIPRSVQNSSASAVASGSALHAPDRTALALAEAMIPGSARIPGADETAVREARRFLTEMSPTLATVWSAAQRILDAASVVRTGRRFHTLDAQTQNALLERWERDAILKMPLALVALIYKIVHFDDPRVLRAMGARPLTPVQVTEPRWLEQVHAAATWEGESELECDVVVVGTGAGGAVVGQALAERGHAVVFVEEGELYGRHDFDGRLVRALRRFYRPIVAFGNAVFPVFAGRMVGGSTAVNGGTVFRTPSWVLNRWCEEMGTDEFLESRMAPYFEQVETHLGVAASPARYVGPIARIFQQGCDALGWQHGFLRRNAPGCEASGFCDLGCRTDARRSTDVAYLPSALERGGMLFTGLKAEQVLLENGRAVGIEGSARNGRRLRVRAQAVVLAAGAIPTPLLLLKLGLANSSGQVGRNLTLHPSCTFSALFDEEIHGYDHIPQGYGSEHFLREGLLLLAAQPSRNLAGPILPMVGHRLMETLSQLSRIGSFGVLAADTTLQGRVGRDRQGLVTVRYRLSAADVERLKQGSLRLMEMALAAGARQFYPAVTGYSVLDAKTGIDRFRKAKLRAGDLQVASYHPLGTCRMGTDPRTSVVGLDHQAHDVRGLFIVDGSTVRGPLGVNPQLTIMTIAARAATQIAPQLN